MDMEELKEKLEKLQIYKRRLLDFNEEYHMKESFIIEKKKETGKEFQFCYNIKQNLYSLSLVLASCFSPDATTCFFIELFNFFQDLPIENDYPYRSNSQSITTYCLKELARKKMIELDYSKKGGIYDIHSYMEMLGAYNYLNLDVQMYYCYFYKKCNLNKEDISLLKSMAHILNIDFSNLKIVFRDNRIYLKMKSSYKFYQLVSGEYFKN